MQHIYDKLLAALDAARDARDDLMQVPALDAEFNRIYAACLDIEQVLGKVRRMTDAPLRIK